MKKITNTILSSFALLFLSLSLSAQVVTEADVTRQAENTPPTDNWVLYTRTATPGVGTFVDGPGTPPLGCGSLQLTTTGGSDKVFLFNYDHTGKKLADIENISYETYRIAGSAQQVTALNMVIDFNGPDVDGGFATLVFEPVYNTDQGPVVTGEWQDWTATGSGIWWSTRPISGTNCSGATSTCDQTWDEIVANNPNATITAFGVNQGGGNPGLITSVDALTIDFKNQPADVYNFETSPDSDGDGLGDACDDDRDGDGVINENDCAPDDAKNDKVLMCRNGKTICIAKQAVQAQLNSGATLGACSSSARESNNMLVEVMESRKTSVFPSPSKGEVNIKLRALKSAKAEIVIMNSNGNIVEGRAVKAIGQVERFDLRRNGAGMYFIKIISEEGVENLKVIVQR